MRGQAPLTPMSGWIFLLRCRSTIHSHAPRGEPRRGGERPWPHRYPIPVPSFGFLTSMISTEQNSSLSVMFPGRMQTYPPPAPAASETTSPPAFGLRNIAIYDLIRSRRRSFQLFRPGSAFFRIMTSKIRGAGEMRYNRAHSRLRCTRIPAGVF